MYVIMQLFQMLVKLFIWLLPFLFFFWARSLGGYLTKQSALYWYSQGNSGLYNVFARAEITGQTLGPGLLLAVAALLATARVTDQGKVRLAAVGCFASALLTGWHEWQRLAHFTQYGPLARLQWVDFYALAGMVLAVAVGLLPYLGVKPYERVARKLLGKLPKVTGPKRLDSGLFGSARFQDMAEMREKYGTGGVILGEAYRVPATGAYDPHTPATWGQGGKAPLLRYEPGSGQSSGHGLNIGGAGSGKSTGSAIPTALEWGGSLVCYDPAREIWGVTKRDRESRGRTVVVLDPELYPNGVNVLAWIDRENPTQDLENVAAWLGGEAAADKQQSADFWKTSSRNLIKAILAYVVLSDQVDDRSLRTFAGMIAMGQAGLVKKFREIIGTEPPGLVVTLLTPFVGLPDETWGGVYAEASNVTVWMHDERLLKLVCADTINLMDMAGGGIDLFLSVKSAVAKQSPGVVRVLLGSVMKAIVNSNGMQNGRCLFLVDEAASLGYMGILQTALAEYRKFKISLLLYYQSIGQLETQWGKPGKATWFDNSTFIQVSAVNSHETAKEVSDMLGSYTAEQESINTSSNANAGVHQTLGTSGQSQGQNRQAVKRMLMQPEEIMGMRLDEQIIFRPGQSPIRCGKAFYYRRAEWKDRVDVNPYA